MAYPKDILNDGEEVVLDRHPHWTYMLGPVAFAVLCFAIMILFFVFASLYWWVGAIVFVLSLGSVGVNVLRWRSINFVVTTDRIMTRVGILSKAGTEIPLDRVMNISYRQSLKERILGVGDLVIESAGENGQQYFSDVSNPSKVQNIIYRQTEIYTQRGPNNGMGDDSGSNGDIRKGGGMYSEESRDDRDEGDRNGSGKHGSSEIPDQISQLDKLRQQGILTDQEFQEKKRQLLDRL